MTDSRSALIVAAPEAAVIHPWMERTCVAKPSLGVPAHVTIVVPFVRPTAIAAQLLEDLEGLFAGFEPFAFELGEARRFPGVLYLAPRPDEPFLTIIRAVVRAYPEHPPYAGEVPLDALVPHVTVALGDDALLDEVERDILPSLPIAASAREVLLIEEVDPGQGRWEPRAAIPLGPDADRQS